MIQSMTGFAARTIEFPHGSLHLELKGVNSRYLDLGFRIADELRQYEMPIRELIAVRLARGKVECRLHYSLAVSTAQQESLDEALLGDLARLQQAVLAALPAAAPLSVGEVLRWPGMLGDQSADFGSLGELVASLLNGALDDFIATRQREGERLATMIRERVVAIRERVAAVRPLIPAAQAAFTDKLKQRLQDALASPSDDRVLQEVAVFAVRIDVAEELTRLEAHLDEVDRVLKKGGIVGKRLDFLMQELNREANTLGSKSAVTEVSQTAMELKLLIEQMREQIQNLE
jgi:uncharacterized protein (TIGR00255 family)